MALIVILCVSVSMSVYVCLCLCVSLYVCLCVSVSWCLSCSCCTTLLMAALIISTTWLSLSFWSSVKMHASASLFTRLWVTLPWQLCCWCWYVIMSWWCQCTAEFEIITSSQIHGLKSEGAAVPFLWGGELVPHLTQCRLHLGLPPYQVVSWFIQPFGHNTPMLQRDVTVVPQHRVNLVTICTKKAAFCVYNQTDCSWFISLVTTLHSKARKPQNKWL